MMMWHRFFLQAIASAADPFNLDTCQCLAGCLTGWAGWAGYIHRLLSIFIQFDAFSRIWSES